MKEKGIHTEFPLDLTASGKRSGSGRFTNPPNKDGNFYPDENAVQQYFMSECKELERFANVQNRLTVVEC